jgi:hypothetical protein
VRLRETVLILAFASFTAGCSGVPSGPAHPEIVDIAAKGNALAISDALENLIAEGRDTGSDREVALNAIRARPEETAAYAFARAAVTGRVVQSRGFAGAGLASEVERWAERSRKLDPNFRDGAASRMLGTLYVMAPSGWLEHGDSEQGIEMLEALVKAHPGTLENHLRLGEAYVSSGDPASAVTYLCHCFRKKTELRHDDQVLLEHLLSDAGNPRCPGLPPAPPAPAPAQGPPTP